jgi:hypothetical protein
MGVFNAYMVFFAPEKREPSKLMVVGARYVFSFYSCHGSGKKLLFAIE